MLQYFHVKMQEPMLRMLRRIHMEQKRRRKFPLMFVVFFLLFPLSHSFSLDVNDPLLCLTAHVNTTIHIYTKDKTVSIRPTLYTSHHVHYCLTPSAANTCVLQEKMFRFHAAPPREENADDTQMWYCKRI